jgi:hypothetical protein
VIVTDNRRAALENLEQFAPALTSEQRAEVPGFLIGTPQQIAEKLPTEPEAIRIQLRQRPRSQHGRLGAGDRTAEMNRLSRLVRRP